MLNRIYAIPILFGICLGLIIAGVQVSASALGSATGDHGAVRLIAVEGMDGNRATIRALGKRFSINVPYQAKAAVFNQEAPERLRAYCHSARETCVQYREKLSLIGEMAVENFVKRYREEIGEIMPGLAR